MPKIEKNLGFGKQKEIDLIEYVYQYANSSKRSNAYKSIYRGLARKLEGFNEGYHYNLTFMSFDDIISEEFIHFLRKKDLKINTVRSIISKLVAVLNHAARAGHEIKNELNRYLPGLEEQTSIYLTLDEISQIYNLKLNKEAEIVRDTFLIGCFTGLRFSDLTCLSRKNFVDGIIHTKTKKTGVPVKIPVHWMVRELCKKYDYNFPEQKSIQNYNTLIKRICKKAGITKSVLDEYTRGYKKISKPTPKYMLVSSHTARRSFATNLYLEKKFSILSIMLMTGHKTEESFFRYIRVGKEENAKELLKDPYFSKKFIDLREDKENEDDQSSNKESPCGEEA